MAKISLKFLKKDQKWENFLRKLAQGRIVLPVKKDYLPEQELELEIFMPEKSEPVVLKTKVKFQDGENHLLHLTLLADIPAGAVHKIFPEDYSFFN